MTEWDKKIGKRTTQRGNVIEKVIAVANRDSIPPSESKWDTTSGCPTKDKEPGTIHQFSVPIGEDLLWKH